MVSEEPAQTLPMSAQYGAGTKIAGYVIEEKIGQGGMAVVFRAHDDRSTGRRRLWNASTGEQTGSSLPGGGTWCGLTICNTVSALAFNHDGTALAAGDASGYAEPWSVPGDAGVTFDVPRAAVGKPIWGLSFTSSACWPWLTAPATARRQLSVPGQRHDAGADARSAC
jgi:hypothetical protein